MAQPAPITDGAQAGQPERPDPDAPVLVAILPHPSDLARAQAGWYRIPLTATVRQLAADYLAFYQTSAFPPEQRWSVHYYAPVRGYHIAARRDLIPDEPHHPRAADRYYRVDLGPLQTLARPVPSHSLRRITFIHTTLDRLLQAREINDLWIKTPGQQRLWEVLQQAQIDADIDVPLVDDVQVPEDLDSVATSPVPSADFALRFPEGRVALLLTGEPREDAAVADEPARDYLLARGGWHVLRIPIDDLNGNPGAWIARLLELKRRLRLPAASTTP